jgi:hypothetical protein
MSVPVRTRPGPLRHGRSGPGQRPDRTPPVPGDPPRGLRPPRTPILPLCPPSPCRYRRAPPVSPLEPLGRTVVNVAAGTGCRVCHRSPAGGDLRHMAGFRRAGGARRGWQPDGVGVGVDEAAPAQHPRATPGAEPPRGPGLGRDSPPVDREPDAGRVEGSGGRRVLDLPEHDPHALVRVGPQQLVGGVQSGCSAAVCHPRSQGPMNHWPQPSIGQPHCSQGWPGSWRPSRVSGWDGRDPALCNSLSNDTEGLIRSFT